MRPGSFGGTDGLSGALFIGFGLFFALGSLDLDLGTAFRMGPGYFPLLLAGLLVLLGLCIVAQAVRSSPEAIGSMAWRGIALIVPAPVFFGLTVRGLGFLPTVFLTAFIASFASSRMTVHAALLLSAALTAFSFVVFSYALGLPFERFGPWLRF